MTHSGISLHFDRAGAAADGFCSGPGRSICTVRLDGPVVYISVQEHPWYCIPHNRFPCCNYWKMKSKLFMGFGGHASLFDEPCGVANTGPFIGQI